MPTAAPPTAEEKRENALPENVIKKTYRRHPIIAWVVTIIVAISTVGGAVNFLTGKDLPGLLPPIPTTTKNSSYGSSVQPTKTTEPSTATTQKAASQAATTKKGWLDWFYKLFPPKTTNPTTAPPTQATTNGVQNQAWQGVWADSSGREIGITLMPNNNTGALVFYYENSQASTSHSEDFFLETENILRFPGGSSPGWLATIDFEAYDRVTSLHYISKANGNDEAIECNGTQFRRTSYENDLADKLKTKYSANFEAD